MTVSVEVYADWQGLHTPQKVGELQSIVARGKETFAFMYDSQWLERGVIQLDPNLQLYGGQQFLAGAEQTNFGVFLDSSPDRWGRTLMQRREAIAARVEERQQRRLTEMDYFLGVHDRQRTGALRYRASSDGPFLSDDGVLAAPPWARLRELEKASWQVQGDEMDGAEYSQWLAMLLAPGSSLGGARPKAGVSDPGGHLWIAKFSSRSDSYDNAAWEMLAYELACKAGLRVPQCQLISVTEKRRAFLTKRFDRLVLGEDRKRLHFASAMTMLGCSDGASHNTDVSYLEIAEILNRFGSNPTADLVELWKRIVFSVCISNTDDHLRNHGFLLRGDGWELSPAFDINPSPSPGGLSLNISETDNSLDLDLVLEVAPYFRVTSSQADVLVKEIVASVRQWRSVAASLNISRAEQEQLSPAFSASEI